MSVEITFLGTGTSQGIPLIACDCSVCHSADPRDNRMRTSALVSLDGHNVLIDTTLEKVFGYAQVERAGGNPDLPHLYFHPVEEPFSLFGYEVIPIPFPHGRAVVTGFRIGTLAYCTDISDMPAEAAAQLQELELLVLGALRPKPHPAHLTIAQAVEVARRIGAKQTFLVHMSHQVRHREQDELLPDTIHLAYDGLKIRI